MADTPERRQWNTSGSPLMPWENIPGGSRTRPNPETFSVADRVVLYDAKGKPLTRPRPRLGFRPPEEE